MRLHLRISALLAFDRGELRGTRLRRVKLHLADCERCRGELARLRTVRSVAAEVTAPDARELLDDIHARMDAGDVVLLPRVDPAPVSAVVRARRAAAVGLVATLIGTSVALAAGVLRLPSWPVETEMSSPSLPTSESGIEVEVPPGRFTLELRGIAPDARIRVRPATGGLLVVSGRDGAEAARFLSGPGFIVVADAREGELLLGVPRDASAIEIVIDGALAALATSDGLRSLDGAWHGSSPVRLRRLLEAAPSGRGP